VLILVSELLDNIDAELKNQKSIILGDLTLEKLDQSKVLQIISNSIP